SNDIVVLRSYIRHRDNLIKLSAMHIHHIQKALSQMNIKLTKVISDVVGTTGMRIIHSILEGERDFIKLAQLKDGRIRSSVEEIAKSLEGDYRAEHLFTLKQALELYEFYHKKIAECDEQIRKHLESFEPKIGLQADQALEQSLAKAKVKAEKKKPYRNEPKI